MFVSGCPSLLGLYFVINFCFFVPSLPQPERVHTPTLLLCTTTSTVNVSHIQKHATLNQTPPFPPHYTPVVMTLAPPCTTKREQGGWGTEGIDRPSQKHAKNYRKHPVSIVRAKQRTARYFANYQRPPHPSHSLATSGVAAAPQPLDESRSCNQRPCHCWAPSFRQTPRHNQAAPNGISNGNTRSAWPHSFEAGRKDKKNI